MKRIISHNKSKNGKVEYYLEAQDDGRLEYHITKGTAYIVLILMGSSGFQVDVVPEGKSWWGGSCEEFCSLEETEEDAKAYIDNALANMK